MQHCWNCRAPQPDHHRFCQRCSQALAPGPEDRKRLAGAVDYLLLESSRWDWLDPARREKLHQEYRARRRALLPAPSEPAAPAPPPMANLRRERTAHPTPRAAAPYALAGPEHAMARGPRPAMTRGPEPATARTAPPRAVPGAPKAPPAPAERELTGEPQALLEARSIRWILLLGGLFLAAAGVGLVRNQWSGIGRLLVSALLLLGPAACFAAAWRLRSSLPLSSRVLAVVGGLLLPTGLVAFRLFGVGGSEAVPANLWNLGSFGVSALVLLALSSGLGEVACLYLGSLCLAIAAGFLGQAAHQPPLSGLAMLTAAFVYLGLAWRGGLRHPFFRGHLYGLSQVLALLGLATTMPDFLNLAGASPVVPLSLLLLGSLFFAGAGYLQGHPLALAASAPVALGAIALYVSAYDLPAISAGLGVLALGTGYLAAGQSLKAEIGGERAALTDLSDLLGTGLTGVGLTVLFGYQLLTGLVDNFASAPSPHLGLGILVALLAGVLYGTATALHRSPGLMYAASACVAYAWFLGAVLLHRPLAASYPADLAWLSLTLVLVAWALRRIVPHPYLAPLVESALALGLLPGPTSLAMRALGLPGAEPAAPATLLVTGLAYLAAVPWLRAAWPLYFGLGWGAAAYATWLPLGLPSREINLGLAFLPFLALLALAALSIERTWGRAFAGPVARMALAMATILSLAQAFPEAGGTSLLRALVLAGYSLGFALTGWPYRNWTFLDRSTRDLLYHLAALAAPAALWVGLEPGSPEGGKAVLAAAAVAAALGAWRSLPDSVRAALGTSGLLWSALVAVTGPWTGADRAGATLFAYGPAGIWLLPTILGEPAAWRPAGAAPLLFLGAVLLVGQGEPLLGDPAVAAPLLGLAAAAWTSNPLRGREPGWLTLAWVASAGAWAAIIQASGLEGDPAARAWWPFCAGFAALVPATRARRPDLEPWLEGCAVASTVVAAGGALLAPSATTFLATNALLAAAYLAVGWRRPAPGYLAVGWILLALGILHMEALVLETDHPGRAAAALGLLVGLAATLEQACRTAGREPLRLTLTALGHLTAAAACAAGWGCLLMRGPAFAWGQATLALTAGGLGLRGRWAGNRVDYHLAALAVYPGYLAFLDRAHIAVAEAPGLPAALWLLGWGERYRHEPRRALGNVLGGLGLALLLAPALAESVGRHGLLHAAFLVMLGIGFLVWGLARRHRAYAGVAALMLLLEIGLHALRVAVLVPWWLVALAAGLVLVGLGLLFEQRRMDIRRRGGEPPSTQTGRDGDG